MYMLYMESWTHTMHVTHLYEEVFVPKDISGY